MSDALNEFPDCKIEWVDGVNDLLRINGSYSISLCAPLAHMKKERVISELKERGIDMGKIFSGYLDDNPDKNLLWECR